MTSNDLRKLGADVLIGDIDNHELSEAYLWAADEIERLSNLTRAADALICAWDDEDIDELEVCVEELRASLAVYDGHAN